MRQGGFAALDEPLDTDGVRKLAAVRLDIGKIDHVLTSPAKAAEQTATGLCLPASIDERLRDVGFGQWTGLTFEEVHRQDADGLAAWLAGPEQGAPGGECMTELQTRLGGWLADQEGRHPALLAITHPMIVRGILAAALDLPAAAVMRFDIAPLSRAVLSYHHGWRLQAMGS